MESDYGVRQATADMGLLSDFGPQPSVTMLLNQLTEIAYEAQLKLPMKGPVVQPFLNFRPTYGSDTWWNLATDAPWWGNNAEAFTSTAQVTSLPQGSLVVIDQNDNSMADKGKEIVLYDARFAVQQIMKNLHPNVGTESYHSLDVEMNEADDSQNVGMGTDENEERNLFTDTVNIGQNAAVEGSPATRVGSVDNLHQEAVMISTPNTVKKRRLTKAKTPIVDDEVRRSNRHIAGVVVDHIQLDNEPRRRKGEKMKTVLFSTVEDLKKAIVLGNLNELMEEVEAQNEDGEEEAQVQADPIPIHMLMDVGTDLCGVPPEEITPAALLDDYRN